eukprot:154986_1
MFLLITALLLNVSKSLLTDTYGGSGGETFILYNQSRISGIQEWGITAEINAHDEGITIKQWSADNKSSGPPYQWGTTAINEHCTSFTLSSTQYINGYRVIHDFTFIRYLGFHISNNDTYICSLSNALLSTLTNLQDTEWIIMENLYLNGFYVRLGGIIDAIQFQFEPIPTVSPTLFPTKLPTSLPTQLPTVLPTKSPTLLPTKSPTSLPTKSPTFQPTKLPTLQPSFSPTKLPTVSPSFSPTNVPTNSPTNANIYISMKTTNTIEKVQHAQSTNVIVIALIIASGILLGKVIILLIIFYRKIKKKKKRLKKESVNDGEHLDTDGEQETNENEIVEPPGINNLEK